MKKGFYTRLAWTGIRKNKQLYYPYFLAGIVMVMVFYIFNFLATSDVVYSLPGKAVLPLLFRLGQGMIGLFSVPFLFYTNASLLKKRKKELGLYNILGMNKKNIFSILLRETVISYGIVVTLGIFAGFVFSKIAELVLVNIMDRQVNYRLYVDWKAVLTALAAFAVIYLLILVNALWQIHANNPIELLHSDSEGERPPKSRLFLAAFSLLLIVAAYYIASRMYAIEHQFTHVFATAALLIVGTFLLFICASVVLCKILQKNRQYYYQTAHFVTISTMSYRMKRNGASLAAISILVTLVLVACSFSVSFYAGSMEAMRKIYPYDFSVRVEIPVEKMGEEMRDGIYTEAYQPQIDAIVDTVLQDLELQAQGRQGADGDRQVHAAHFANMLAMLVDGRLNLGRDMRDAWFTPGSGNYPGWEEGNERIVWLHVLSLQEYNGLCGTSEKLEENTVFVLAEDSVYLPDEIILRDGSSMAVDKTATQIPKMADVSVSLDNNVWEDDRITPHGCENVFLVVPELYGFMGEEEGSAYYAQANYMAYDWEYCLDLSASEEQLYAINDQVSAHVTAVAEVLETVKTRCFLQLERGENYYSLAGALLFIAVIMDVVFIAVTALIMYYKQISEGYEDQKRFIIMRKVGMTPKEIRSSINSQMLTVFVLPLLVAGVHLVFTFNIVYMLQRMVVADNKPLLIRVMAITYLLFAMVYAFVYLRTSRTYFNIVNKVAV